MAFESGGEQRFPYSYSQVFAGLLVVLPDNGYKIKSHDKIIGRIECSAGVSMFSWGENISISVEEIDPNSTRINIHSSLKVQGNRRAIFTGEGRNSKNVTVIVSALSNYLKAQKQPAQASPFVKLQVQPAAPSKPVSFYIYLNEQVKGPFSAAKIKALLQVDSAGSTTPCCPEGSEEWQTIDDLIT